MPHASEHPCAPDLPPSRGVHRPGLAWLIALAAGCSDGAPAGPVPAVPVPRSAEPTAPPPQVSAEAREQALEALRRGTELFRAQMDPEQALEELRRAVALDPGNAEAHEMQGKVLLYLSSVWFGTRTLDRTRLAQAIASLERADELRPEAASAYWLGHALGLLGETERAVEALELALERDPAHGLAHKQLGLLFAADGRGEQAKEHLLEARALLPQDDEVLFHYGLELEADGDLAGARAAYEAAIAIHPARPGLYSRLTVVCERLGDGPAAARASEEFHRWSQFGERLREATLRAEAAPEDPEACLGLGLLYREAGMHDSALTWSGRALTADPANLAARLLRAEALVSLGRGEEAEVECQRILETEPGNEAAAALLRRARGEERP